MQKRTFFLLFAMLVPFLVEAQKKEADPYQEKYEWRVRQEVLYGVYIPKDVNEALVLLNRLTDEESKTKFKNLSEQAAVSKLFFQLRKVDDP